MAGRGAREPERAERGGADLEGDRRSAAGDAGGVRGGVRLGWLVELLEGDGFDPHLVHPSRCKAIASARLKNDKAGAEILAQLLRADLLPEAWIAPPAVRQLRALLRHRVQLVRLRTLLRNRIHAVLADHGHDRPGGRWSGPGRAWLASLPLPAVSREVVGDGLALIDAPEVPIDRPAARSASAPGPTHG